MCISRTMFVTVAIVALGSLALAESPGLGRPLRDADIPFYARYIMPDGTGLPPGQGSTVEGKAVWQTYCASCHGTTGNEGPVMPPVGPATSYAKPAGKFWPYATTLFDYIRRAMPFPTPKVLSDNEVYAVTAYILSRNDVIGEDVVINATSLPKIVMPGRSNFIDLWTQQKERPY